jgi:hypothetical protein
MDYNGLKTFQELCREGVAIVQEWDCSATSMVVCGFILGVTLFSSFIYISYCIGFLNLLSDHAAPS